MCPVCSSVVEIITANIMAAETEYKATPCIYEVSYLAIPR